MCKARFVCAAGVVALVLSLTGCTRFCSRFCGPPSCYQPQAYYPPPPAAPAQPVAPCCCCVPCCPAPNTAGYTTSSAAPAPAPTGGTWHQPRDPSCYCQQ